MNHDTLAVAFNEKRGQIEVGGPYAGAEFHHSRPLPTRISFFYPVANSIDLSTDYWQRDASQPFTIAITIDDSTREIGQEPFAYRWTPYRVTFADETPVYATTVSYQFTEDLPLLVFRLKIVNVSEEEKTIDLSTDLKTTLRTSHAYVTRDSARVSYVDNGSTFRADFVETDVDSVQVFVVNAGEVPVFHGDPVPLQPVAAFSYRKTLGRGEAMEIIQLIGTTRSSEAETVRDDAAREWTGQVDAYERRIAETMLRDVMHIPDASLSQTAQMAKALLLSNRHYLHGQIVPMPCPAEYNFFFTHDLLLTDLGAVRFDIDRVRDDLRYLLTLSDTGHALPHAYYWRDGRYIVEWAGSDNWNHLWFVQLAASYLRHSGDTATLIELYPMLERSIRTMLDNERDGLMYAFRPDWWDIGHLYGARAYLTTLMIRSLEAFTAISLQLDVKNDSLLEYVNLAQRMRTMLVEAFWDTDAGYLFNQLDTTRLDKHYYSGSLLAAAFGLLDESQTNTLLDTAKRELLDPQLGIRNAMPPDFHQNIDVYRFNGMEAGEPYIYMNGGIWPQGTAWYALALLAADRPDEARDVLKRYLSLDSLINSPNGQPAFYEYRNGNAQSPDYGSVDKPTFLWAGGWYLHVLYALAGVHEDAWNLSFDPALPGGFESISYDLMIRGRRSRISFQGSGAFLRRILVDGRPYPSAIMAKPAQHIELELGRPETPYLAAASSIVQDVIYDENGHILSVTIQGLSDQRAGITVVSPSLFRNVWTDGATLEERPIVNIDNDGITSVFVSFGLTKNVAVINVGFDGSP